MSSSIPTNQTLYVNNLNDKLKINQLKEGLYYLFGRYGPIMDIVAIKSPTHRGQAFIVYSQVNSAIAALRDLQSFEFFGKPLKIQYAKSKSNAVAKADGTYVIPKQQ
ncbi:hypothetical protein WA158_003249 [Blastocystis sp. Blastoise]